MQLHEIRNLRSRFHVLAFKLFFVTFNMKCRLHVVCAGKPSELMSNFWTVWIFKTEPEPIFGFLHTPNIGQNC